MNSEIIEIETVQENDINRTRLVFSNSGEMNEIILEGKGRLKTTAVEIH